MDDGLHDALDVFAATVDRMMAEKGLNGRTCTTAELKSIVRECFEQEDLCWADLIQWVRYGDDKKAKTLDIIQASLRIGRVLRY